MEFVSGSSVIGVRVEIKVKKGLSQGLGVSGLFKERIVVNGVLW